MKTERVVYINGEFVPESQAKVSIHDLGFLYGDAVFDTTRTFGHKIFRLNAHLERLYSSMKYMRIDPGLDKNTMSDLTNRVLELNLQLLGEDEDYWVTQRVTRGNASGPIRAATVIIECSPLPFVERAAHYRDGLVLVTPSVRRTPPQSMSPRAKMHNYINIIQANMEVKSQNQEAVAMLLDERGNLAEGMGANLFVVRDGVLFTPSEQHILAGISRMVTIELAKDIGIEVREMDLDLYDAYTSDEAFVTSTSYCICPVKSINGVVVGEGSIPGNLTERLQNAYSDLVGIDIVAQYVSHLKI